MNIPEAVVLMTAGGVPDPTRDDSQSMASASAAVM
jgi:hypothetical protein